jgi:hypothetical protein
MTCFVALRLCPPLVCYAERALAHHCFQNCHMSWSFYILRPQFGVQVRSSAPYIATKRLAIATHTEMIARMTHIASREVPLLFANANLRIMSKRNNAAKLQEAGQCLARGIKALPPMKTEKLIESIIKPLQATANGVTQMTPQAVGEAWGAVNSCTDDDSVLSADATAKEPAPKRYRRNRYVISSVSDSGGSENGEHVLFLPV